MSFSAFTQANFHFGLLNSRKSFHTTHHCHSHQSRMHDRRQSSVGSWERKFFKCRKIFHLDKLAKFSPARVRKVFIIKNSLLVLLHLRKSHRPTPTRTEIYQESRRLLVYPFSKDYWMPEQKDATAAHLSLSLLRKKFLFHHFYPHSAI